MSRLWILLQVLYLAVIIAGCLGNERPRSGESPAAAFIGSDEDMVSIPAEEFVMEMSLDNEKDQT